MASRPDPTIDWSAQVDGWTTSFRRNALFSGVCIGVSLLGALGWMLTALAGSASKAFFSVFLVGALVALYPLFSVLTDESMRRSTSAKAAEVRRIAAIDPAYAAQAANPRRIRRWAPPLAGAGEVAPVTTPAATVPARVTPGAAEGFRLEDVTSAAAARLKLSRDDVEARLDIRFEQYWDGAEFVGFRSFGLAGIGRVALVARAGRDDVELHLDPGAATPPLDRLAVALGLGRDDLA